MNSAASAFAFFILLAICQIDSCQSLNCYACTGQCDPYSPLTSNRTEQTGCSSCKYVVAFGGFGDLSGISEVSYPICSTTSCTSGQQDAYYFNYLYESNLYTMPAYSECCNTDLCNSAVAAWPARATMGVAAAFAVLISLLRL